MNKCESVKNLTTVKAFVVTPKMTKNSIIFRGGVTTKAINFLYPMKIY